MWRLLLAAGLLCCGSEGHISCKNEGGVDVDWFILYKGPKLKSLGDDGSKFIYVDSLKKDGFTVGSKRIDHQQGVLANTLEPIFTDKSPGSKCGYVAYNDQPPDCDTQSGCGHSKGVVMADGENVVWLLHSTPRFPLSRESNKFYPPKGLKFAQTFICVTFPKDMLTHIVKHLQLISAHVFESANTDDKFSAKNFANIWIKGDELKKETVLYQQLTSLGKNEFLSVFKHVSKTAADGDLYITIANTLQTDLFAQTWGRQTGRSDSYCAGTGPRVANIESVKTPLGDWNTGSDHSKWCVTEDGNWVCVGDSNRAESQFDRPGGALCIHDREVNAAFRNLKSDVKICAKKRTRSAAG